MSYLKEIKNNLTNMIDVVERSFDEVASDELTSSHRYHALIKRIAEFRRLSASDETRHFAFGLLHDALIFTKHSMLTSKSFSYYRSALSRATADVVNEQTLDAIEDQLLEGGFELVPQI